MFTPFSPLCRFKAIYIMREQQTLKYKKSTCEPQTNPKGREEEQGRW